MGLVTMSEMFECDSDGVEAKSEKESEEESPSTRVFIEKSLGCKNGGWWSFRCIMETRKTIDCSVFCRSFRGMQMQDIKILLLENSVQTVLGEFVVGNNDGETCAYLAEGKQRESENNMRVRRQGGPESLDERWSARDWNIFDLLCGKESPPVKYRTPSASSRFYRSSHEGSARGDNLARGFQLWRLMVSSC